MGKLFSEMLPEHESFIKRQHIFFVGSAPLDANEHVNISPKGYDTLRVLSSTEVAYLDLTGSGNETSTHLDENGRITFMFVAFDGAPVILRLYGTGRVFLPNSPEWDSLIQRFEMIPGARQIVYAKIHAVKTSCGMSIPFFSFDGKRDALQEWALKMGDERLDEYHLRKNTVNMDGKVTPLGRRLQNE